ncbi:unnamed protein product [Pipistrellus nathusii]|uniref:Ig-like domain-containing protein n=1 Tax=Pipistrellus nathusii TaxID=59473 RepID=A0ABN9ZFK5_PIPNA
MESPSGPAHRRCVPWQGLLLTASLLTFWSLPTTAQFTMESVPPNAAEGKNVLLRVHNLPGDLKRYAWYKEEIVGDNEIVSYVIETQTTINGPASSGRETIYPNGSLLLQNITLKDTGKYILQVVLKDFATKQVTGQLHVYPVLSKPSISSNNSKPEEHKDPVMLTCEPPTENTTYLWLINSQILQDSARLQLSLDNRTLTLLLVTRNDTGPYECETQNPVSAGHSDPFTLNVLYGPDAPTISPSDSYYLSGTNLNLSCQAASNPPAQYSWLINGMLLSTTQELFISNITSKNSGSYTCLAHNSNTGLNRTMIKNITVYDDTTLSSPGLSDGAIAGIVIGVLAGVALIAALLYFLYIRKTGGASDQRDLTEHKPSASNHSQGHSDNSSNKMDEITYSSLNFNGQESKKPTYASPSPTATESVYSEVKKK